jgi:hypothetical protein
MMSPGIRQGGQAPCRPLQEAADLQSLWPISAASWLQNLALEPDFLSARGWGVCVGGAHLCRNHDTLVSSVCVKSCTPVSCFVIIVISGPFFSCPQQPRKTPASESYPRASRASSTNNV